ncbi:MAG TPA: MotA/TolQ/ExbB proton channel family protein [bacterium]|nr:MotA/TolQ/ExbB proton channel family protein [bacterium]
MSRARIVLTVLAATVTLASSSVAQQQPAAPAPAAQQPAADLDALLRLVEKGKAAEQSDARDREARFQAAREEQRNLLAQARQERTAQERRSDSQEKTYDENELLIADVSEQLNRRLGSLRELFGVLQQVSSDTQGLLETSVTAAQIPDRGEVLSALTEKAGSEATLPSIEEIEKLWFLMQQEMTETGKVVRFPATVITADGREEQEDVVRVGAFNIVAPGKYLTYIPETGNLSELGRQPQSRFTASTSRLFEGGGATATFGVDPTRGQILATYLERPSFRERIDQGGIVGYVIIALGILGLLIAFERLFTLGKASAAVNAQLKQLDQPRDDNALGRILQVADQFPEADVETLELRLGEAVFRETPKLTRAMLFIKIISVVAPLLGLLGTVTGMIVTFQAITLFGTGDPKLMAGGISQALVTTVLGLTVAIPMVLLHTLVNGRSKHILTVLQEQSAGLVATRSERKAG